MDKEQKQSPPATDTPLGMPLPPPTMTTTDLPKLAIPDGNDVDVRFGQRIITVKELTAIQLSTFIGAADPKKGGNVVISLVAVSQHAIEGLSTDELWSLKPSQLKVLWEAFEVANSDFIKGVAWLGVVESIKASLKLYGQELQKEFSQGFTDLLAADTSTPKATPTQSSVAPSENSITPTKQSASVPQ